MKRKIENPKTPTVCPYCGIDYDDFKTGHSFADVKGLMWVGTDDPARWRYKRRHTVLGSWRELKQKMFLEHIEFHELEAAAKEEEKLQEAEAIAEREAIMAEQSGDVSFDVASFE